MSSFTVVFDFWFEFKIELITNYIVLFNVRTSICQVDC